MILSRKFQAGWNLLPMRVVRTRAGTVEGGLILLDFGVSSISEGTVASWLVHLTRNQAVQFQALVRDIVFCSLCT